MTKFLLIALLISAAAAAGLGWLLKGQYEKNGELKATIAANELAYKTAIAEANQTITGLRQQRELDQQRILFLGEQNNAIRAEADSERARLDKFRSTLEARTLAKPKVTERAARMAIKRQQCSMWEAMGGQGECPR